MKKVERFKYITGILLVIAFAFSFVFDIKSVMLVLFSLLLLSGYILWKEKVGQELIVAFLLAILIASFHFYEYTTPNLFIGKVNLFPVISWTFGLVLLRELYEKLNKKYKLAKITLIYILGLFLVEYIGYYLLNIQLKTNFTSLLGTGIIHAPLWLKITYLLIGPIYILLTDYLKVK